VAQGPELLVLRVLWPLVYLDLAYQVHVFSSDGFKMLFQVMEAVVVRLADVAPVGDGPDAVAVADEQARRSLEGEPSPADLECQSSWTLLGWCNGTGSLARLARCCLCNVLPAHIHRGLTTCTRCRVC
jgi:hypothetical protein